MKSSLIICLGLLIGIASVEPLFFDPYSPGPYEPIMHKFANGSSTGVDVKMDVWTPTEPGKYPVIYFLDGLAMGIPPVTYSDLLTHIASHGFAVVSPLLMSSSTASKKVPYFISVLKWAEDNLEDELHTQGIPPEVSFDFATLLAISHSAGGHVIVSYLKETCGNFKGLALMSPVDGADPFGIIQDFCITPGKDLNFVIPTLHLYAGYDPKPGGLGVACAPSKLSNERFWNALNPKSQRWSINATEFTHSDVLDEVFREIVDALQICAFNEDLSKAVFPTYRKFAGGSVVAFFKALMEDEYDDYLKYLEDPGVMSVATSERHINPTGSRPKLFCLWEPPTA